jgi:hypothetical protein
MHRIRLGPPWTRESVGVNTKHLRRFGSPRNLDAGIRVWLVCETIPDGAEVALNGALLAANLSAGRFEAEITRHLTERNVLEVTALSELPPDDVSLVIG